MSGQYLCSIYKECMFAAKVKAWVQRILCLSHYGEKLKGNKTRQESKRLQLTQHDVLILQKR